MGLQQCLEWDSNPSSNLSSPRPFVPQTVWPLQLADIFIHTDTAHPSIYLLLSLQQFKSTCFRNPSNLEDCEITENSEKYYHAKLLSKSPNLFETCFYIKYLICLFLHLNTFPYRSLLFEVLTAVIMLTWCSGL
jgi:hypothetical protein